MTQTPEDLGQKIKAARERAGEIPGPVSDTPPADNQGSAMGQGMRVATDLAAALAVSGFLGYMADKWLGTKPWIMLAMIIVGFAAGILNAYRAQMGKDFQVGFKKPDNDKNDNGNEGNK